MPLDSNFRDAYRVPGSATYGTLFYGTTKLLKTELQLDPMFTFAMPSLEDKF
jgi:hypothetical protein